jgi:thiol-disulfide isomerase/thioredoxin
MQATRHAGCATTTPAATRTSWSRRGAGAILTACLALATPVRAGSAPAAAPHPSDRIAGLSLGLQDGRLVIRAVEPGSAAGKAGLLPGDVILVLDGASLIDLDPLTPQAALDRIGRAGSDELRMVIGRGAGTLQVSLPLRSPQGDMATAPPPRIGAAAAPFEATTFKGETLSLADLRGHPVLLDFWASWCPPCRDQVIPLKRMAVDYADGLQIVGVSLDEDPKAFEAFVYNHQLPGRQIRDGGWFGPISTLYHVADAGLPYDVLIGADGRIVSLGTGLSGLEDAIRRAVAGAPQETR